jgi:hypothetical protein
MRDTVPETAPFDGGATGPDIAQKMVDWCGAVVSACASRDRSKDKKKPAAKAAK